MSSNQNKKSKEMKKVSSIANALHSQLIRSKMGAYFAANMFLFAAIFLVWIFQVERENFDELSFNYSRYFTTRGENLRNLVYVVSDNGDILLEEDAFWVFIFACSLVLIAMFFQFISYIID